MLATPSPKMPKNAKAYQKAQKHATKLVFSIYKLIDLLYSLFF